MKIIKKNLKKKSKNKKKYKKIYKKKCINIPTLPTMKKLTAKYPATATAYNYSAYSYSVAYSYSAYNSAVYKSEVRWLYSTKSAFNKRVRHNF